MKKVFLALITGVLLFSCNDAKKETEVAKNSDWITQNLKGRVQSLEETSYTPDSTGKTGEMDSCCISTDNFDDKGYNNSSIKKDSKGKVTEETTITRYEAGQVKEVVTMKNGKKADGFTVQIGKDGKYTGGQATDSTGKPTNYFTDLTEDEYGSVLSGTEHNPDSSVKSSFTNEYKKGLQVAGNGKDSSGKVSYTYRSELDDKGNVIKSTETNITKDSTTTTITTYKYDSYDEQGNWTQRTAYNDKSKATKVKKRVYTYYKKD